jgi:hypothetical protein
VPEGLCEGKWLCEEKSAPVIASIHRRCSDREENRKRTLIRPSWEVSAGSKDSTGAAPENSSRAGEVAPKAVGAAGAGAAGANSTAGAAVGAGWAAGSEDGVGSLAGAGAAARAG